VTRAPSSRCRTERAAVQTERSAQVAITGHAFIENLRRGHYELAIETHSALRTAAAFTELAQAI